jgi:hypothetical protein
MVTSSILYRTIAALGAWVCFMSWGAIAKVKAYRPEKYYMRGPGPKWREKHPSGHTSGIR